MSGRCLPVTNDEGIPKSFRPAENGGTSIFIIGTDKSAEGKSSAKQDMINAVLRNYWMAILHYKLEVIIDDFEINADTLDSIMRSNYKDSVDYITTKRRLKPLAYYDAVVNCNKEGYVHITDHKICTGDLHLFVKKHHDACDKILCMRRNRMLIEVRRPQTNYGYNAVLLCDGAQGDKMLRLLENASHDKWSVRNLEAKTGRSTEQAQKVLDTIEEFVNKSIEQIFHTDNVSTSNITGLEDYLFVPEDLIANPNSVPSTVENANPHIGNPTGEMQDEGASITNIIDETVQMPERKAEHTGPVIVSQRGGTTPSSTGTRLTGQGVKHEAEVGPKPETPQASGNFQLSEVDEELPGNFMEYIPVKFRVLAKKIGGQMYHDIIFHSPCAATSGRIDIVVGGEQKNVALDIAEAMPGIIEGNSVGNLSISQGRNKVRVRFNDNLKHAVILQTYGYK